MRRMARNIPVSFVIIMLIEVALYAQSPVDEQRKSVLNDLFGKPAREQQKAEMQAFMADVQSKSTDEEKYGMLSGKLFALRVAREHNAPFVLALTSEAIRLLDDGVKVNISGMKHAFVLLTELQKKGDVSGEQIKALISQFNQQDALYRKRSMQQYLAQAYMEVELWNDAANVYKELIIFPKPNRLGDYQSGLVRAYAGAGKTQEISELDANARKEQSFSYGNALGDLYESLGHYEKSLALYEAYFANPEGNLDIKRSVFYRINVARKKLGMSPMQMPKELIPPTPPQPIPVVEKKQTIFDEIVSGNTNAIVAILKSNPDAINDRENGMTPLHKAAVEANVSAARILLAHGADVNAKQKGHDAEGCVVTPLTFACAKHIYLSQRRNQTARGRQKPPANTNAFEIVRILLENKATPNTVSYCSIGMFDPGSPLSMAASAGDVDLMKILLAHGAVIEMDDNPDCSAADQAVKYGAVDALKLMIEKLGRLPRGKREYSLLHMAAYRGNAEIINMILDFNPDLDSKDKVNDTPFQSAMRFGHEDVFADAFRKHGIPVPDMRMTPSAAAFKAANLIMHEKYSEAKAVLVDYPEAINARPYAKVPTSLFSSLLTRTQTGKCVEMQKWLLTQELDVKQFPDLHLAIWYKNIEAVKLLVDAGADVNLKYRGSSPLAEARRKNAAARIIEYLEAHGAKD